MKKITEKILRSISVLAIVILLICSCLTFSACAYSPSNTDEWYIESIVENGKEYHSSSEDYYNGTLLSSDYMVFAFKKDGSVTIVDVNGNELKGTFTEKKSRGKTIVTVKLADGTILKGSCARYYFDATWYEFTLSNDKITYNLSFSNEYPRERQNGVILKEIYPEIARLAATDIQEISYHIEDNAEFSLVGARYKKAFLKCFSTASFRTIHYYGDDINKQNSNPATLIVKTDAGDYAIPLYIHKIYNKVYIAYDSTYYQLRGDFAEWLLGFTVA